MFFVVLCFFIYFIYIFYLFYLQLKENDKFCLDFHPAKSSLFI